jgi:hypothetical protein
MKKIILITCFFIGSFLTGMAQTEKGSKLIGGTGTLHFGAGNYKGTLLAFTPRFGGFAANNFVLGASAPLYLYSYEGETISSIGISPFLRGYFGISPTRFFLEGRAGYQRYSFKSDDSNFNNSSGSFVYGLGMGVIHFLSNRVGLEFMLSYDNAGEDGTIINLSHLTGVNFNVGFQVYLPSRK